MEALTNPPELNAIAALAWTWAAEFLPRLGGALLLLVVGLFVARWASRLVAAGFARTSRLDPTFAAAIAASVRYAIVIVVMVATLGQLGIQTTSIIAALGAAGLAIGLALQGTLSNIAAGLMLLWLRPFRIGETIETGTINGTVREIGLFATLLDTADGLYRFVPNASLWNVPLVNYSRNGRRRIDLTLTLGHGTDLEMARKLIDDMVKQDPRVLQVPAPNVALTGLTDTGTNVTAMLWTRTADFGDVKTDVLTRVKAAMDGAGIPAPFRITQAQDEPAASP